MNIKIHRPYGARGAVVEITAGQTKILLDGGVNLEENETLSSAALREQCDFSAVNAVFLTHCRTDYATMAPGLLGDIPFYTGKLTGRLAGASASFKARAARAFAGFYADGASLIVGDLKITPHLVDDALYDSFLLAITDGKKTALYAGGLCANGRKSFEEMVKNLPIGVDVLLCEGGTLTEEDTSLVTERDLEEQAAKLIGEAKGPVFALQPAAGYDRAATLYRAAKRNKRVFLEDLYMAQLAGAAGKAMPNPAGWQGVKAYLTTGYKEEHPRYKMFTAQPRLAKAEICAQKFVMCIRPTMKKYIKTLSQCMRFQGGILLNALPPEAMADENVLAFLAFAGGRGLAVTNLRASGHADAKALRAVVEAVKPQKLLPLCTRERGWLAAEYPRLALAEDDEATC